LLLTLITMLGLYRGATWSVGVDQFVKNMSVKMKFKRLALIIHIIFIAHLRSRVEQKILIS